MDQETKFKKHILSGYTFKGDSIILGTAILNGEAIPQTHIKIPLKSLNRHGLIAGATGTGKTKTLQVIAEALSGKSIPVMLMDIKGDLSGIAEAGKNHPKIEERMNKIGLPYTPVKFPVELLSLSDEKGVRLRATVSEFGPILFSKILELNSTQESYMSVIFKYCDDKGLPLLDLKDIKKVLNYITNEGKEEVQESYGRISTSSIGTILRKIIELEQQGADQFFGEKSFEVDDLIRIDEMGNGVISILRLTDLQDRPKLFSTFMLSLLAEIYSSFPEEGDLEQPKLVIFIDEAHLIFDEASKALRDQIETIVKLIRSKGVGIYFCTQNPTDIPEEVLSQLGLKIQHALRAFTAKDRKMIRLTAENYPLSEFYKTDEMLTSLGIGEAAITALNEKGVPTPLAATLLCAPKSRMDILSEAEIDQLISSSQIINKYNETIDRESAYELLNEKLDVVAKRETGETMRIPKQKGRTIPRKTKTVRKTTRTKPTKGIFEEVLSSPLSKQIGRTLTREFTRGILGVLGLGGSKRR